jgi:putative flippase GtrA
VAEAQGGEAHAWQWRAWTALLSRYGLAGVLNTAIGFAIIALLDVGARAPPALANAVGYGIGIGISFVLNRRFVFRSEAAWRRSAPRYLLVVIAAFLLNQAVLRTANAALGAGTTRHLLAQLAGMATYTLIVFTACRLWVFRPAASP